MAHIVFIDSTVVGLAGLETAKRLGHQVTFILPKDASILSMVLGDSRKVGLHVDMHEDHIDQFFEVPSLDDEVLGDLLDRLDARTRIDGIVTTSEAALLAVARQCNRMGLPHAAHEAIRRAINKDECRACLAAAGLRSPRFQVLSDQDVMSGVLPEISFPLMVKPTRGFGKFFSALCRTEAEYRTFAAELAQARNAAPPTADFIVSNDFLIEQYISGTMHSVEAVVQAGKVSCYATTDRLRASYSELLEMTTTVPAGWLPAQKAAIVDYVQNVVRALGISRGILHIELICAAGEPWLVEINARVPGSGGPIIIPLLGGHDPLELMIRLGLGEEIAVDDNGIRNGGSSMVLGAVEAGYVSMAFDPAAMAALEQSCGVVINALDLYPGKRIERFIGNASSMGYFIVLADTPAQSLENGARFTREVAALTGLKLAQLEGHDLSAPALA